MNRQGAQPLRFPGYAQPPPPHGGTENLRSGRLQNTSKLGNGTGAGWGFGGPTNGISGLTNAQSRQAGTGPTSFAQTIGGSHPATPLDLSEFPSLSGNSQPQFQNNSNPIWQRPTQQTPVQRPPQQSHTSSGQQHPPPNQQHPASTSDDEMFIGSSHLQGSLDDYRQTSQNPMAPRQPPSQGVDDFPPLGRNGTDGIDNDQRGAFGAFAGQNAFASQPGNTQPRQGLPSGFGSNPADSTRSSSVVDRTMSPSSSRPNQGNSGNLTNLLRSFDTARSPSANQQQQQSISDYDNRIPDRKIEDMSDLDKYGLAGFLARIRSDDPMVSGLARGQDLAQLGMNLNSSEPIWPTWSGPFADANSRPLQPEFKLPECYTVTNVHRVREKVPSFSDETLFWIFYTQPRDLVQDLAACELTNRNWRFHKGLQMWLTKDLSLPEPQRMADDRETGSYVFFNHKNWEKIRRTDFQLEYHQLAPTGSRMNGGG